MASESIFDQSVTSSDLPPDSFYVPSDDEHEWFDRNAVMQRKSSLKLGLNRNFNSFTHRSNVVPTRKLRTPTVFALPKTHKVDVNPKPGKSFFRSRSEPGWESAAYRTEPGSPRVSCTGRVQFNGSDGKKTGFSRIVSSLFGGRTGRTRTQKRGNSVVS